jgi:hypothetical protein
VQLVGQALERLRQMFDVLCYSTQRFELQDISDHLRRIFDLVLSSNVCEIFGQLLGNTTPLTWYRSAGRFQNIAYKDRGAQGNRPNVDRHSLVLDWLRHLDRLNPG